MPFTRNEFVERFLGSQDSAPEVASQLFRERGVDPNPELVSNWINQNVPEAAPGAGTNFASFLGQVPGMAAGGAIDTAAMLGQITNYIAPPTQDPGAQSVKIEKNRKYYKDKVKKELTPDWAMTKPSGWGGQAVYKMGEFMAETLPETVATIGSNIPALFGKAGAKLALRTALKKGVESEAKLKMYKGVGEIVGREMVEGAGIGFLAGLKSEYSQGAFRDLAVSTGLGDTEGADKALGNLVNHVSDEMLVNAAGGVVAGFALRGAGKVISTATKPVWRGARRFMVGRNSKVSMNKVDAEYNAKLNEITAQEQELVNAGTMTPQLAEQFEVVKADLGKQKDIKLTDVLYQNMIKKDDNLIDVIERDYWSDPQASLDLHTNLDEVKKLKLRAEERIEQMGKVERSIDEIEWMNKINEIEARLEEAIEGPAGRIGFYIKNADNFRNPTDRLLSKAFKMGLHNWDIQHPGTPNSLLELVYKINAQNIIDYHTKGADVASREVKEFFDKISPKKFEGVEKIVLRKSEDGLTSTIGDDKFIIKNTYGDRYAIAKEGSDVAVAEVSGKDGVMNFLQQYKIENVGDMAYFNELENMFFDPLVPANKPEVLDTIIQHLDDTSKFMSKVESKKGRELLDNPVELDKVLRRGLEEVYGPQGILGPTKFYEALTKDFDVVSWNLPFKKKLEDSIGAIDVASAGTKVGVRPSWMDLTWDGKGGIDFGNDEFFAFGWPKEFASSVAENMASKAKAKVEKLQKANPAEAKHWQKIHDSALVMKGVADASVAPEVPLFTGRVREGVDFHASLLEQQSLINLGKAGNINNMFHEIGHYAWRLMPDDVKAGFARYIRAMADDPIHAERISNLIDTPISEKLTYEIFANTFMKAMMANIREGMGHMSGLKLPDEILNYLTKVGSEISQNAIGAIDDDTRVLMQIIGDKIFENSKRMKYANDENVQGMLRNIRDVKESEAALNATVMEQDKLASMYDPLISHMKAEGVIPDDVEYSIKEIAEAFQESSNEVAVSHGDLDPKQLAQNYNDAASLFLKHVNSADTDYVNYIKKQVFKGKEADLDALIDKVESNNTLAEFITAESQGKATTAYQNLENEYALLRSFNNYLSTHNPEVYNTMSTDTLDGVFNNVTRWLFGGYDKTSKWVEGHLPENWRRLEGDFGDLKKFHNILLQDQHLSKENIFYSAVSRPLRGILEETQTHMAQIFEGDGLGEGFSKGLQSVGGKSMGQFLELKYNAPTTKATLDMLWEGNKVANELSALTKDMGGELAYEELAAKGLKRDDYGILDEVSMRKLIAERGGTWSDEAYDYYRGVTYTMSWIGDDMVNFLKGRRFVSQEGKKLVDTARNQMGLIKGMVPQTRYGKYVLSIRKYTLDESGNKIKRPDGSFETESIYFARSDQKSELHEKLRQYEKDKTIDGVEYEDGIVQGIKTMTDMPEEAFFGGSPETYMTLINNFLETAGKEVDIPKELDNIAESIIIDSTKNGAFFSHTKQRKNIAGYDEKQLQKVLFDYVHGYTRFKARSKAMRKSLHALRYIKPKREPNTWRAANKLLKDSLSAQSEWSGAIAKARNLVLMRYLGFNISSAALQITQNPLLGVGRMGLDGIKRSGRKLLTAQKDVFKMVKGNTSHLDSWEKRALEEGHVSNLTFASMVDNIQAKVRYEGQRLPHFYDQVFNKGMWMMKKAEENNRKTILLASYRAIRQDLVKKSKDQLAAAVGGDRDRILESIHRQAMDRASQITIDTHFAYTRQNLPSPIRGNSFPAAVGRNIYLLNQFTHNFWQNMRWLAKTGKSGERVILKNMAILMGMGGIAATPGYEFFNGIIEKESGVGIEARTRKAVGKYPSDLMNYGLMGMVPLTRSMSKRINPGLDITADTFVPKALGLVEESKWSYKAANRGDWLRAMRHFPLVPTAISRVGSGQLRQQYEHGTKTRQGKVIEGSKLSFAEAMTQLIGINPMNEGLLKYYRQRTLKGYVNRLKNDYAGMIRHQWFDRGKMPTNQDWQDFFNIKTEALNIGMNWNYTNPLEMLKDPYVHVDQ